jgi:alpha-1,2-mannosyltransferase
MRFLTHPILRAAETSWLWAGLTGGVILLVVWQISAPPSDILFSDFLQAYYSTGERLWHAGSVITWPLGKTCTEGFVNIPILGWLFVPFAWLSKPVAAWTFLVLGVAVASAAWALLVRLCRPETRCAALLLFLFLVNGPMVHSFREGNITHFVLLLLVIALLLWRAGAEYASGLVLGLCAILKLPLVLFGLYFLLRRRWRIVAGGATAIGAIVALSIAVFGLALNIGWYNYCVGPFVGQIMPGFNVQSVDAFLFRLVDGQAHLHIWYLLTPTRAHTIARTIVLAMMFIAAFLLIRRAERREPMPAVSGNLSGRDLLEFALVLSLALVASPVSWSHYYLLLLLPWGLYLGGQLPLPDDAVTKWLMGAGIVLASLPVLMLPKDLGVLAPLLSRTLVSAIFVGGMLTLAALARGAWYAARPPALADPAMGPVIAVTRLVRPAMWSILSPSEVLTRNMVIFLIINACAVNAILWFVAPPGFGDTVLQHTWDFLLGNANDDSWGPMMLALEYYENEYVRPPYTAPIYTELVINRGEKFQYPASSLFFIAGVRAAKALLSGEAPSYDAISSVCNVISWAAVVLTAIATIALFENRLRLSEPSARHDNLVWLRAAVVIGLSLTFYPVVKAFTVGQIQAWINGLFALAFLLWATRCKAWAGVAIGIVALIKPHFGILLVWAMLRREWRFLVAGAVTVSLGLGLSLFVFGWENHVDYLRLLSHLSQRGESYYPNQSFNGFFNRLMSIADPVRYNNLNWRDDHFPPFNAWVYGGTLISSVVILGLALFRRRYRGDADGMLDFCTIAVSCTLASPITWEHHYGILLPIFAVLVATSIHNRRRLIWLAASYLLASNYIPITKLLAYTPFNFVQSYLLVAGLIVLVLLHRRTSLAITDQIEPGASTGAAKAALA